MEHLSNFHIFINESYYYNPDREYSYDYVVSKLMKGPSYLRVLVKDLPMIEKTNEKGEKVVMTKIPEVVYNFLFNTSR